MRERGTSRERLDQVSSRNFSHSHMRASAIQGCAAEITAATASLFASRARAFSWKVATVLAILYPIAGCSKTHESLVQVLIAVKTSISREKISLDAHLAGDKVGEMGVRLLGHPVFEEIGCKKLFYYDRTLHRLDGHVYFEVPDGTINPGRYQLQARICGSTTHEGLSDFMLDHQGFPPPIEFKGGANSGIDLEVEGLHDLKIAGRIFAGARGTFELDPTKGAENRIEVGGQSVMLSPGSTVKVGLAALIAEQNAKFSKDDKLKVPVRIIDKYGHEWEMGFKLSLVKAVRAVFTEVRNGPLRFPDESAKTTSDHSIVLIGDVSQSVSIFSGEPLKLRDIDLVAIETSAPTSKYHISCWYQVNHELITNSPTLGRYSKQLSPSAPFMVTRRSYDSDIKVYRRRTGKVLGSKHFQGRRDLKCSDAGTTANGEVNPYLGEASGPSFESISEWLDGYLDTDHQANVIPRQGSVIPGQAIVHGSLDTEVVQRVIGRHISEVNSCYQTELNKRPELAGRVLLQFTIAQTGAVIASVLKNSTMGITRMENCVVQAARGWVFPKLLNGGIVIVSSPFDFAVGGTDADY